MAIVGDSVGTRHIAKAFGFMCLFISGGLLCGPAISGTLYDLVSYSATWASAFAVLVLGVGLQSLVVERSSIQETSGAEALSANNQLQNSQNSAVTSPLLPSTSSTDYTLYQSFPKQVEEPPTTNVYAMMLYNTRVSTALVADVLFAMTIASFDTTIPLHIQKVFAWKSLQAGFLFLLLQLPSLILVVPAGWLKDKIGMRMPVTVGFLFLAPSLWLLGLPGEDGFEWANHGQAGQIIYVFALLGIGVWRTLLLGFGGVEVMQGATDLAVKYPKVLGENGVYSRAFSLSNISWKLGMFIGPLVSGSLTDAVGYYYMNVFFGMPSLLVHSPVN
ncbi:Mfs transporter [Aspergillus sclerotialis]|uniref:Mfs transporter n=1 Tax=Aspergillus sclerotialis TaxID=2070753 RepID=A0A3A2ZXE1_9EURO|nr:Mfs transporter [Aspergillus sclerotialis]